MADQFSLYRLSRRYLATQRWAVRGDELTLMGSVLHLRSMGVELDAESRVRIADMRTARLSTAAAMASEPGLAVLTSTMGEAEVRAAVDAARGRSGAAMGAVAVIPLCGVIDQKVGSMSDISGGTSVDGFMQQFRQCLRDPGVIAIVLDVDSPGGNVSGVPEAAAEILAARGTKPIVAVADPMIASAAYYLSCAADEIVCLPSGEVGSIGVLAVHDDFSAQNEMIGYKPTYISFGAYKTELNPDTPLSADAQAYQQQQIDAIGNDFVRFVAKARGVPVDAVRSDFGQGRMLLAKDALAVKMVDRIDTLDATVARVARQAKPGVGAPAARAASGMRRVAGVVPKDVSEALAPKNTPWSAPTLSDFTNQSWDALSDAEQRKIAGHYAWAQEMPPATFGDLKLPHHRASDGKVVYRGVVAALGRLDGSDIPEGDQSKVRAHLEAHEHAFEDDSADEQGREQDESAASAAREAELLDLDLALRSRR